MESTNLDSPEMRRTFASELQQVGYNVPAVSESIFQASDPKVELAVGATINKIKQDVCVPNNSGGGRYSSRAYINVQWEIADVRNHQVIYKVQTEGSGLASGSRSAPVTAIYNSFDVAVKNLLADKGFHDALLIRSPKSSTGKASATLAGLSIPSQPLWRGKIVDNIKTITKNTVLVLDSSGGHGSGFYIDGNGHVLTNHHVIEGVDHVIIRLSSGEELEGHVLASDPNRDVALIATQPLWE